jgi:hypothetical protein
MRVLGRGRTNCRLAGAVGSRPILLRWPITAIFSSGNNTALRLSADGTLHAVAGNGTQAYSGDGGAVTAASFINPAAIAIDKAGNIYIEDFGKANSEADPVCGIRRVSPDGTISTIAAGAAVCGTQRIPGVGFTVDPGGNPGGNPHKR